ncbi:MAG: hypothetical protein HY914_22590 [Desulfomonile tiedjei]|nr:hypothetical protein [Desulfomonile tiedjei]
MRTASVLSAAGVFCIMLVLAPPSVCFGQDRPISMDRARMERAASAPAWDRERHLKNLKDQLELLDLEQKIFQENEQKQALHSEQRQQQLKQQLETVDLEEKIQELRDQQQALQRRHRRDDLKRQMDTFAMERKVSELNRKRQAMQHQQRSEDLKRQIEQLSGELQKPGEPSQKDSPSKKQ